LDGVSEVTFLLHDARAKCRADPSSVGGSGNREFDANLRVMADRVEVPPTLVDGDRREDGRAIHSCGRYPIGKVAVQEPTVFQDGFKRRTVL
jgi:hypothetical protein